MNHPPKTVSITLFLIFLTAVFWLGFAMILALGFFPFAMPGGAARWVMGILAIGAAAALFVLAMFLIKRKRLAYFIGVLILATIAVLSITDQFGFWDLFSLLICLGALGLLLKDRAWYLQSK